MVDDDAGPKMKTLAKVLLISEKGYTSETSCLLSLERWQELRQLTSHSRPCGPVRVLVLQGLAVSGK